MRRQAVRSAVARPWPIVSLALLLGAAVGLASAASLIIQRTTTLMLVNVVIVVGLYVFIGNSGVLSFGHIGFMAVGAYITALITIPPETKEFLLPDLPAFLAGADVPAIPAAIIAGLAAALFALLIGIPLMRLSGLSAALAMFAVLAIVNVVARNWTSVTRGTGTMTGVPTETTIWTAFGWALVTIAGAFLLQESRLGLRLRASRDDPIAAKSIGISILRERVLALVISGFFIGIGGALFAEFQGSFNPDAFFVEATVLTLAMLVIGGISSLAGAVVGTMAVSGLAEGLRQLEGGVSLGPIRLDAPPGLQEIGLALLMLLILILRPKGIMGGKEIHWPFTRRFVLIRPVDLPTLPDTVTIDAGGKTEAHSTRERTRAVEATSRGKSPKGRRRRGAVKGNGAPG